jgi:hypothetical protein
MQFLLNFMRVSKKKFENNENELFLLIIWDNKK